MKSLFNNLIEVRPLLFHQRQRLGLEHLDGLDVYVAVGNQDNEPFVVAGLTLAQLRQLGPTGTIDSSPAVPSWED